MNEQKVNIELSLAEATMLLKFLDDLGDKYSYAGCNDLMIDNTDENWRMVNNAELCVYVDEEERERPTGSRICTTDFVVCGYIATNIKNQLPNKQS